MPTHTDKRIVKYVYFTAVWDTIIVILPFRNILLGRNVMSFTIVFLFIKMKYQYTSF